MLLDEDPAALIHECIGNFNITPDRSALARINESLSTLNQSRELRLTDATTSLKRVTRQLQTLDQQHNYNLSSQNPTEHAAQILALDSQKFKVAKEASDLEIEGEKLENELASLETQLRDLQTQDSNWGMGNGEEQDVLRLKLYRSLGIDLERREDGQFKKAIVRNVRHGETRLVEVDPKYSRSYYVNLFWESL